jgi:hypothetical protein
MGGDIRERCKTVREGERSSKTKSSTLFKGEKDQQKYKKFVSLKEEGGGRERRVFTSLPLTFTFVFGLGGKVSLLGWACFPLFVTRWAYLR